MGGLGAGTVAPERGLWNDDGMMCSQNALVSALLSVPAVQDLVKAGGAGTPLRKAMQHMYGRASATPRKRASLRSLGVTVMPTHRQQDGAEYLRHLLGAQPQLAAMMSCDTMWLQRCPRRYSTNLHMVEHPVQAGAMVAMHITLAQMQEHGTLTAVLRQRSSRAGTATSCDQCATGNWGYQSREMVRYRTLPKILVVTANRVEDTTGLKREDVPFGYPLVFAAMDLGPKLSDESLDMVDVPGHTVEQFEGVYSLAAQTVHHGTAHGGHVRAVHMLAPREGAGPTNQYVLVNDEEVSVLPTSRLAKLTVGGTNAEATTQMWVYVLGDVASHPPLMVGEPQVRATVGRARRPRQRPDRAGFIDYDGPTAAEEPRRAKRRPNKRARPPRRSGPPREKVADDAGAMQRSEPVRESGEEPEGATRAAGLR